MEDKNFILELIEVYRTLPALWKVKSKEYANRGDKNAQYTILLEKYKEKFPQAEKKDVGQKINSLRTAYRKELKRIDRLDRSGAGALEEAEPNLFYFQAIDFLRDNEQPCSSQTSMDEDIEREISEQPTKRKKSDATEELMVLAAKRLKEPTDENDNIVASWGVKFKNMSATQRLYADKFINEILFEGQMGTLDRNSMQLNVSSGRTTPQSSAYSSSYCSSRSSTPITHAPVPRITPQPHNFTVNSSHTTPTFTYNTNGTLTRISTPITHAPVPLITPQPHFEPHF